MLFRSEGTCGVWKIDLTRLVFSARELGISGYDLQVRLYEEYRVSTELADEENVVCVTDKQGKGKKRKGGHNNEEDHYSRMAREAEDIDIINITGFNSINKVR